MKFIRKILEKLPTRLIFCFLYVLAKLIPKNRIENYEMFPRALIYFEHFINIVRLKLNKEDSKYRQEITRKVIMPCINILFDKNYVNYAQLLLLGIEEYLLSINSEKKFEKELALFSNSAISAGLRYREKFPLELNERRLNSRKSIFAFVSHSVAFSGNEIILQYGNILKEYRPKFFSGRVYEEPGMEQLNITFQRNHIQIIPTRQCYDVFSLRKIALKNPVKLAIWVMPPFHMFFIFSFGLARKQLWLSQYLRPNLGFEHLDGFATLGGAGKITTKSFGGKKWDIIPQVINPNYLTSKKIILYTPARIEKIKQKDFLNCVIEILKINPDFVFKWTGYSFDHQLSNFFKLHKLESQNFYVPWADHNKLIHEIKSSDLILATFPLGLGTVENIAVENRIPIVSYFNLEKSMFWRDVYWEAISGNKTLKNLLFFKNGKSKIIINKNNKSYVRTAVKLIQSRNLRKLYIETYQKAYEYTYTKNTNNIEAIFVKIFKKIGI